MNSTKLQRVTAKPHPSHVFHVVTVSFARCLTPAYGLGWPTGDAVDFQSEQANEAVPLGQLDLDVACVGASIGRAAGATREGPRLHLSRRAFASMADLAAIAIILDVISQFKIFREFHPVAALLVGPVVIALAFSLSRALGNRIARGRAQWAAAASRPG